MLGNMLKENDYMNPKKDTNNQKESFITSTCHKRETKYLRFTEIETKGKTKAWRVENKEHSVELGIIKWQSGWRRYCYFMTCYAFYSKCCLIDISNFIKEQMDKRK